MQEKILYGVIGLLAGIILTWVFAVSAVNGQRSGMMQMMGLRNATRDVCLMGGQNMSGVMQGMMSGLQTKAGDEFDKAFLSEMIVHHQGAVDMANTALKNAQHQEIKALANTIISAQTKEISQMRDWQQTWYKQ